jgi:FG-GAP-like repeat
MNKATSSYLPCLFGTLTVVPILVCLVAVLDLWGQSESEKQNTAEIMHGVRVSWPAPWIFANRTRNSVEIAYPLPPGVQRTPGKVGEKPSSARELVSSAATMTVEVEPRSSHRDALKRLSEIGSEYPESSKLLVIVGWPAIERVRRAPLPSPGEAEPSAEELATFVTTAVAAGADVVRFETTIAPGMDSKLADSALQIARRMLSKRGDSAAAKRELGIVSKGIVAPPTGVRKPTTLREPKQQPPEAGGGAAQPGATLVQSGVGELEVAVSSDGQHVVVAANSGFSYSDNGGQSFTRGGGTPCVFNGCDGDPSLAVGRSGTFYYSWIGFPNNQPGGNPPNGTTDSLSISTDNGHTFTFRSNAVVCPNTTPTTCSLPDQEHIAADRTNLSRTKQDQVYLVWRNFSSLSLTPRIVCSSDGASTWSGQVAIAAAGDFPRINVGGDGFVYVVYRSGANLMLNKYSSCSNRLAQQAEFPRAVTAVTDVVCPVPGLDRCNNGNLLSSHMVAVDDTNAQHVFVSYSTNTAVLKAALGNEDVIIRESLDGGTTWRGPNQISVSTPGRRFMPWICSTSGSGAVSWYDRRSATVMNNDRTDFFVRVGARVRRVFLLGPETNISNNTDAQCASGFPCGARSAADFNSCSVPTAGALGSGCPKYGDYNGIGCAAGNIVAAWASATTPQGAATGTGLRVFATPLSAAALQPLRKESLFLYRPGSGAAWVARSNGDGTFTAVYSVGDNGPAPPNGIADYDLLSDKDRAFAFDYNGDGKEDLFFYRPGSGAAWVARSNGDGTFTAVYSVGDNGPAPPNGIADYDLLSPKDVVLPFDFNGDGKTDLFLYRPGSGAAWVARSNGDGTFTPVYSVGDNGPAPPNGIADYDLLSDKDRVLVFDYNGDGKDDLFLYRPGSGAAWVARSNGDGTFTAVYSVGDNGPAPPNGIADYDLLSPLDRVLPIRYSK